MDVIKFSREPAQNIFEIVFFTMIIQEIQNCYIISINNPTQLENIIDRSVVIDKYLIGIGLVVFTILVEIANKIFQVSQTAKTSERKGSNETE